MLQEATSASVTPGGVWTRALRWCRFSICEGSEPLQPRDDFHDWSEEVSASTWTFSARSETSNPQPSDP